MIKYLVTSCVMLALMAVVSALPLSPCVGGTYKGVREVQTCQAVAPPCSLIPFQYNELISQACAIWCCPKPGGGYSFMHNTCGPSDKLGCCNDLGAWVQPPVPTCP